MVSVQDWMRAEWRRSGLPLYKSNEACGVRNAATRKFLAKDDVWYFPPAKAIMKLAEYANTYGDKTDIPYFSLDRKDPLKEEEWSGLRAKWNHIHGVTNVWHVSALHGSERLKASSGKALHYNQKPMEIIEYLVRTSTDEGDVVWDPFAGLATTAVCCMETGRRCFCAEISSETFDHAIHRITEYMRQGSPAS